jgi:hypothetical protein
MTPLFGDNSPEGPDPRFLARVAVRQSLDAIEAGDPPGADLNTLRRQFPAWVDAMLEEARSARPEAVALLRKALGLNPDPWREMVDEAIAMFEGTEDPSVRIRLAASLLVGDGQGLSALTTALAHHPRGGPLLAAAHGVARLGEQRRLLSGYLVRRRRESGGFVDPGFYLNRESPAFHQGYLEGDLLVMVFREYPGRYAVFALHLGEGITDVVVRPVGSEADLAEVLHSGEDSRRESLSMEDCRSLISSAVAALGPNTADSAWRALGHLIEERLFTAAGEAPGFVVGEASARLFLDRLARVLLAEDLDLLSELIFPGSAAEIFLDLFGPDALNCLLGVDAGVSRLEVIFETTRAGDAAALVIGRSPGDEPLTCTRLHLTRAQDLWWLYEVEALGIGSDDRMVRQVWEAISGPSHLPLLSFDDLPPSEQELIVGLIDDGYRLDEVAGVVHLLRTEAPEGDPGTVAAACHLAWARLCGEPAFAAHLIDRYGAEPGDVYDMLDVLPAPPQPIQLSARQ